MNTKQTIAHIKHDIKTKATGDEKEITGYLWAIEDMEKEGEVYDKFLKRFSGEEVKSDEDFNHNEDDDDCYDDEDDD